MSVTFAPHDEAFRQDVRSFIAENYPAEMRVANPDTDLSKEQSLEVREKVSDRLSELAGQDHAPLRALQA